MRQLLRHWKLSLCVGLIAAAVAISAIEVGGRSPSDGIHARRPHVTAAIASATSELDQFAVNAGAEAGDTSPTGATWVSTDQASAYALVGGATPLAGSNTGDAPTASPTVYVLEVFGQFVDDSARVLKGSPTPTGNMLIFILDKATGHVLASGIRHKPLSLTSLGTPQTDSLAGFTPTVTSTNSS